MVSCQFQLFTVRNVVYSAITQDSNYRVLYVIAGTQKQGVLNADNEIGLVRMCMVVMLK